MRTPRERGGAEEAGHAHRWRALGVTQLAGFMGLLDVSIVNVALPSLQQSLHASVAEAQRVVSGYSLTFGLVSAGHQRSRGGQRLLSRIDIVGALLLGAGVLSVLLPLVQVESGGLPLLDTRLLSATPGYPAGALLALLYFIGFSGIWVRQIDVHRV